MDPILNKKFSISLITLYTLISILGIPLVIGIFSIIYGNNFFVGLGLNIFITILKSIVSFGGSFIIGLFLFANANKLNQDKWTWLLLGIIYGQYSLLFYILLLIFNKKQLFKDLIKEISFILLLLIILHVTNIAANFYKADNNAIVSNFMKMKQPILLSYFSIGLSILPWIGNTLKFALNILFAIKFKNWMKSFDISKKIIWIISVLLLGLFPILLMHKLIIIKESK